VWVRLAFELLISEYRGGVVLGYGFNSFQFWSVGNGGVVLGSGFNYFEFSGQWGGVV
jgi:hypothetical protein